jgi:hypothetical protein
MKLFTWDEVSCEVQAAPEETLSFVFESSVYGKSPWIIKEDHNGVLVYVIAAFSLEEAKELFLSCKPLMREEHQILADIKHQDE